MTARSDLRRSDLRAWVTEMSERRSTTVVIRARGVLAALLDVAGPAAARTCLVLACCGLPRGEATGLRVEDVDAFRRRLDVRRIAAQVGDRIIADIPKPHALPRAARPPAHGREDPARTRRRSSGRSATRPPR